MGAYIHRVLILVGCFLLAIHKIAACFSRVVLADFYTTGMTVVLMGFASRLYYIMNL